MRWIEEREDGSKVIHWDPPLVIEVEDMPKLYTSYAWMYRRYVVDKLKEQEIADLAGTTQATINRWLEKHNLKKKRR